jgi:ISXO2-like transposase domain
MGKVRCQGSPFANGPVNVARRTNGDRDRWLVLESRISGNRSVRFGAGERAQVLTYRYKGHPDAVSQQGRAGRRQRLKGARGRGTLSTEKPPVFGLLQRGGEVVIHMLDNVQQKTIQPIITRLQQLSGCLNHFEETFYERSRGLWLPSGSTNLATAVVAKGTTFYTDDYAIYDRLGQLGYDHYTVNHSQAE